MPPGRGSGGRSWCGAGLLNTSVRFFIVFFSRGFFEVFFEFFFLFLFCPAEFLSLPRKKNSKKNETTKTHQTPRRRRQR